MTRTLRAILFAVAAVAAVAAAGWAFGTHGQDAQAVQARSDHFWGLLAVNGSARYHFDTLNSMADQSDIVVMGRIVRVAAGREVRDLEAEALGKPRKEASVYFADATIAVDEVVKGSPAKTVKLQLLLPTPGVLDALQGDLPTEREIYFLTDMGAYFAKENPKSGLGTTLKGTFDFVSPQGLLRDFGSSVGVTADEGDMFLKLESRKPFSEVLAETKSAASN